MPAWPTLLAEAAALRDSRAPFPLPAYSEFLPAPLIGVKPTGEPEPWSRPSGDDDGFRIRAYEELQELRPGLAKVGRHIADELARLLRGEAHNQIPKTLLRANPAHMVSLAAQEAALLAANGLSLAFPLALSRTQDDKGRVRWTVLGTSDEGPARAFWHGLTDAGFHRAIALLAGDRDLHDGDLRAKGVRVLPYEGEPDQPRWADAAILPDFAKTLVLGSDEAIGDARFLVTFRPLERLPEPIRAAYAAGRLRILPTPATLLFWHHTGYRALAKSLPRAIECSLLQLFPRSENTTGLRIPQSGWLDETPDALQRDPERRAEGRDAQNRSVKPRVRRSHRWERHDLQEDVVPQGDAILDDPVTIVLFSAKPDDVGLYGKPMARNAQIWTDHYERLLDGPRAGRAEILAAERAFVRGGRFGYRFHFPPMRVGAREVVWHRPIIARLSPDGVFTLDTDVNGGYLLSTDVNDPSREPIALDPRFDLPEPAVSAVELFERDPGHRRGLTTWNVRKIIEWAEMLHEPLDPQLVRRLIHVRKENTLAAWLTDLPSHAIDRVRGDRLVAHLRSLIGPETPCESRLALTFEVTRQRSFELAFWREMAHLSEGDLREKNNADLPSCNAGRTGGKLAIDRGRSVGAAPQLELVGEYFHRSYADLIEKHGMTGRAYSADHRFRWETEHDYPWMMHGGHGSPGNAMERNVVCVIPGTDRGEAIVMGDHYDTAYMEDLYYTSRGGDLLRAAAAGADDNHSASAALLLAADVLLPLAREGKLKRDVWLVHLTGEEFPADCLGARALSRAVVEKSLKLERRDGTTADVGGTRVRGVLVMDMIAHNNDRDRDVFQIAPGEGAGSARIARRAHVAAERWNEGCGRWNKGAERHGRGRARRMPDGREAPPVAEHLRLAGEVRAKGDPRSALYNTDGQIFSDVGIPVVLFMENYDIRRQGYHDMEDTMKNIDLDYGAAMAAIAIETVADCAISEVI